REKIAKPLGMDEVEAASGIFRIENSHMSDLLRKEIAVDTHDTIHHVVCAHRARACRLIRRLPGHQGGRHSGYGLGPWSYGPDQLGCDIRVREIGSSARPRRPGSTECELFDADWKSDCGPSRRRFHE